MNASDLKAWRETLKMKPGAASARLGIGRSTYWRWETGKLPVPEWLGYACAAIAHGLPKWGGSALIRQATGEKE